MIEMLAMKPMVIFGAIMVGVFLGLAIGIVLLALFGDERA